jgi:hypothetical protein
MTRSSSDQAHPMKTQLRSPALDGPLAHLPRPLYRRRSRRFLVLRLVLILAVAAALIGGAAVWANAFGIGTRFEHLVTRVALILHPPPDRPTAVTVEVPVTRTDPPDDASLPPIAEESPSPEPSSKASPGVKPTPTPPVRRPVDVDLLSNPKKYFVSEQQDDLCAPAGVQTVLAILHLADTSDAFQRKLESRIDEWESYRDSHNGGWGPGAMVKALDAYGAHGYEIRAYGSRADALFDASVAISTYRKPVILLAWRGAHTWVMTGYKATADPRLFQNADVTGTYIMDPWYPRISSIWGPSDPPGTFQDRSEMRRNYLQWQRPEGQYPDRDGRFIAVLPTTPLKSGG